MTLFFLSNLVIVLDSRLHATTGNFVQVSTSYEPHSRTLFSVMRAAASGQNQHEKVVLENIEKRHSLD